MTETSDVEAAERIGRRRARMFAAQAAFFLCWQALFFTTPLEAPMRNVDALRLSAWFFWVLALLLMLATGGGLLRHRKLRGLLNDELARQNRTSAYVTGFWAAAGTAILLYVVDLFEPVSGREAVHAILSVSIAAALLAFAVREGRNASSA